MKNEPNTMARLLSSSHPRLPPAWSSLLNSPCEAIRSRFNINGKADGNLKGRKLKENKRKVLPLAFPSLFLSTLSLDFSHLFRSFLRMPKRRRLSMKTKKRPHRFRRNFQNRISITFFFLSSLVTPLFISSQF